MSDAHDGLIVERDGAALWITLDRPERLNALSSSMTNALADLLGTVRDDRSLRVIVLRGSGRAFCAGLDVAAFEGGGMERLPEIVLGLHTAPQAVMALVHGPAVGGGLAFALASDVRVAGTSASFRAGFTNLGLTGCELGTSYFLPRLVGAAVTAELLLTGRAMDAQSALRAGLVTEVVDDADLEAAGRGLVADMLRLSPMGLRRGKEALHLTERMTDLATVIRTEAAIQRECSQGPNFLEAIKAFRDRRPPVFVDEA